MNFLVKYFKCFLILLLFLKGTFSFSLEPTNKSTPSTPKQTLIGIIVPLVDEGEFLQTQILEPKDITIEGIHYKTGKIQGKNIVFAYCGLGMINATLVSTRLVRDFHPDLILMSGSAGKVNPDLQIGDVVIGKEVVNLDFGEYTERGPVMISHHLKSPQSEEILPLTFTIDEKKLSFLKANASQSSKIFFGKIATTNNRPEPPYRFLFLRKTNVDVVDMEGVALMQVGWFFKTPCIVIRGVSDTIPNFHNVGVKNMKFAANNASKVLIDIIAHQ